MHIIIDPGHGGRDPGAQGWVIPERTFPPTLEKDLTLLYALDLEKELITRGHQVTLTRRTDKYVSLQDRAFDPNNPLTTSGLFYFSSF